MNIRSLEYFLVVAEEGNVTRAAERLNISQQALSGHIRRLEEEYKIDLFDRKPVFRLSLAGEQMMFYGRQILSAESEMRAAFSDIAQNARGVLRVGISRLRGKVFFPLIWKLYHPSHPNISVEMTDGNGAYLNEQLLLGNIDLYIGVNAPVIPHQNRIRLANEELRCILREDVLAEYFPDTWQELLREFSAHGTDLTRFGPLPVLAQKRGNRLRDIVDLCLPRSTKLNYIFETNDQELLYQGAREGLGAGLISPMVLYEHHLDPDYRKAGLHIFRIRNSLTEITSYLVTEADIRQPDYVRDFISDTELVFRNYVRSQHLE